MRYTRGGVWRVYSDILLCEECRLQELKQELISCIQNEQPASNPSMLCGCLLQLNVCVQEVRKQT